MSANHVWLAWLHRLGWAMVPGDRVMDALVQASFEEAREMWRYRVTA